MPPISSTDQGYPYYNASHDAKSTRRQAHVDMVSPTQMHSPPRSPGRTSKAKKRASAPPFSSIQHPPINGPVPVSATRHSHSGHSPSKPSTSKQHRVSSGTSTTTPGKNKEKRTSFETYMDGPAPASLYQLPPGPKQPLYNYIRPQKDGFLNLSPSSSPPPSKPAGFPSPQGDTSRSTSLDIPRPMPPPNHRKRVESSHRRTSMGGGGPPRSPRSSVSASRPTSPTSPFRSPKRRSNFLDIPFHEGMTTEDVEMPGPECLTPPGHNPPPSFGLGSAPVSSTYSPSRHPYHHHTSGGSMSGQTAQQMMSLANVAGRFVDVREGEKKKKGKGWKRLRSGFKSLMGGGGGGK